MLDSKLEHLVKEKENYKSTYHFFSVDIIPSAAILIPLIVVISLEGRCSIKISLPVFFVKSIDVVGAAT
jgi:hypothetical protein